MDVEFLAQTATRLTQTMRENVESLLTNCGIQPPQHVDRHDVHPEVTAQRAVDDTVSVSKHQLDQLVTEVMQMREFLPKVLGPSYIKAFTRLARCEEQLYHCRAELETVRLQKQQISKRLDSFMTDSEVDREEKYSLQCQLSKARQQLSQQSEFCSSMGACACSLLWRVSRIEDNVDAILSGSTVEPFLEMVCRTLEGCVTAYPVHFPQEMSDEAQFVLSLCGIITNIAASATGRDFLSSASSGNRLIDALIQTLSSTPRDKTGKQMKNLILMALYNISINQKGLKYLSDKKILPIVGWILQDEQEADVVLNTLRLVQSLIMEPQSPTITLEALEAIPLKLLESLSQDRNQEVKATAMEILSDLQPLHKEE